MYSGVPDPRSWVLPRVIEEQSRARAAQPFVSMIGGETLTFGQFGEDAAKVAGMLSGLGVRAGDRVAIMLPNGHDILRAWAGVCRLGAVAVLINTELTGAFLTHPLRDAKPRMVITHADFLEALTRASTDLSRPDWTLVAGAAGQTLAEGQIPFDAWRASTATDAPLPAAHEAACIMYTSGTTGPPKGVLMPHAHCFLFGLGVIENLGVTEQDHYYTVLPLFHANGLLMQIGAVLIAGARATVRGRFSASEWLSDLQRSRATITHSLGATSAFIQAQPAGPGDRDHHLRLMLAAPNLPDHERVWRERFGIPEVVGGYGMTEVNIPLYGERGVARPGTCGRPYARFEVEIRDPETDFPVEPGEVGEITVRPRIANGFMAGYFGLPEKTAEAWRNLWFHTGDAGRMSPDGYVTFVDRIKDCIRRRGENISAADLEATFMGLSGVSEVAAFAVPSDIPGGEDEIMLAIVPQPGSSITGAAVAAHAQERVPRFAWPRYLELRAGLPKTSTEKVRKEELKVRGVAGDAIDLEPFYR